MSETPIYDNYCSPCGVPTRFVEEPSGRQIPMSRCPATGCRDGRTTFTTVALTHVRYPCGYCDGTGEVAHFACGPQAGRLKR